MNRSTWKAEERRWAERLGGERVPVTGRQRGAAPDVEHPVFGIEIKMGKVMSPRMQEAVEQAVECSRGRDKIPLVGITQTIGPGRPNKHFVLMRLEDFEELRKRDREDGHQEGYDDGFHEGQYESDA